MRFAVYIHPKTVTTVFGRPTLSIRVLSPVAVLPADDEMSASTIPPSVCFIAVAKGIRHGSAAVLFTNDKDHN